MAESLFTLTTYTFFEVHYVPSSILFWLYYSIQHKLANMGLFHIFKVYHVYSVTFITLVIFFHCKHEFNNFRAHCANYFITLFRLFDSKLNIKTLIYSRFVIFLNSGNACYYCDQKLFSCLLSKTVRGETNQILSVVLPGCEARPLTIN
jgi:hypothetical protein